MKITKHKTSKAGIWHIKVDGLETPLTIEKGGPKRFGELQDWLLCHGDRIIMVQHRANDIIPAINDLLNALGVRRK